MLIVSPDWAVDNWWLISKVDLLTLTLTQIIVHIWPCMPFWWLCLYGLTAFSHTIYHTIAKLRRLLMVWVLWLSNGTVTLSIYSMVCSPNDDYGYQRYVSNFDINTVADRQQLLIALGSLSSSVEQFMPHSANCVKCKMNKKHDLIELCIM